MLIIGELINTSRRPVREAVERRDADYIADLARRQVEAGADYLDVNCGTLGVLEAEAMVWLAGVVKGMAPLCIDSPDPRVLEAGLACAGEGPPMINSLSAEKERFAAVLPLVRKYGARVVALAMDDNGLPNTAADRIGIVRRLVEDLTAAGVAPSDIYIDPLVKPVGVEDGAGAAVLETVRFVRERYPQTHTVCGLSNVSFGLPNRRTLNRVFLVQTMTAGMDAHILDPLDRTLMGIYWASRALLGQDPFCERYLKAHRSGLYES